MAVVTCSQTVKQENFPSVVAYCKVELTALVVLSACLKISKSQLNCTLTKEFFDL
jgi:hypothetical protein